MCLHYILVRKREFCAASSRGLLAYRRHCNYTLVLHDYDLHFCVSGFFPPDNAQLKASNLSTLKCQTMTSHRHSLNHDRNVGEDMTFDRTCPFVSPSILMSVAYFAETWFSCFLLRSWLCNNKEVEKTLPSFSFFVLQDRSVVKC